MARQAGDTTGPPLEDWHSNRGVWKPTPPSTASPAYDLLEQTGELASLPEHLASYFNYAAYARDCELSGDIYTVETASGAIHVFWSR